MIKEKYFECFGTRRLDIYFIACSFPITTMEKENQTLGKTEGCEKRRSVLAFRDGSSSVD